MVAVATYLDIWIMRRAANYIRVGYSSTAYAMFLLCRDIRRKPLGELVAILSAKLADDDVAFDGAPKKGREGIPGLGLNQFSRRYIFHMLARITAFTESQSGKADLFDKYVDRTAKNPFDIEHIWAGDPARYAKDFSSAAEFYAARDHVAGLLLLPADVNRSLQDKAYEQKTPIYRGQNLYAASLTDGAYAHQPQFLAFRDKAGLPFKAFPIFGKVEQAERRELVQKLVETIWSPERLRTVLQQVALA